MILLYNLCRVKILGRKSLKEKILIVKTFYGSGNNASKTAHLFSMPPLSEGTQNGQFKHLRWQMKKLLLMLLRYFRIKAYILIYV
jgi:hypothetical protein